MNSTILGGAHWSDERVIPPMRRILERDWGITTREALLETLESLRTQGARADFERARQAFLSGNRDALDGTEFFEEHLNEIGQRSLVAWDVGRMAALALQRLPRKKWPQHNRGPAHPRANGP